MLNNVLRIQNRQFGKEFDKQYDSALARLMVRPADNWKGIGPNTLPVEAGFNPEPPIFAVKFALKENYSHILAIANEDGKIALQNTFIRNPDDSQNPSIDGDQCHFNAVFDLAWMPFHLKLVSASGDHTAKLWDVTESKLVNVTEFHGHSRSVKTAVFRRNDCSVFATGGRDGAILVWDIRACLSSEVQPKVDNRIFNAHIGGPGTPQSRSKRGRGSTTPKMQGSVSNSSITGLAFQDDYTLISCGPGDGIIKVWDLRRTYSTLKKDPMPKHSIMYAGKSTFKGFTNIIVDEYATKLYANCMDNKIYSYNINTYDSRPVMVYEGLQNKTFYIKSCLSPDGKYLLSGSSDEKAYIWNVNNSNPLVELTGHSFEVTCVAWAQHQNNLDGGDMTIVTCSDDSTHKIWRIGPETIPDDERILLRGKAEVNKEYYYPKKKTELKFLESTPRSLKRLVELTEKTPTSCVKKEPCEEAEKSSKKRSFKEMNDENLDETMEKPSKRQFVEARGRRLFSPSEPSTSYHESDIYYLEGPSNTLSTILEEMGSPPHSSNSKNFLNVSPVAARRQLNIIKSPKSVASRSCASPSISYSFDPNQMLNSPTSNLPNFVIDGDAPHLVNAQFSPQRRTRNESVDWLTKMRKQKLLSLTNSLDKNGIISSQHSTTTTLVSDAVDSLNSNQNSTNSQINHTNSNSSAKLKSIENKEHMRKKDITLLKYFTLKSVTKAAVDSNLDSHKISNENN